MSRLEQIEKMLASEPEDVFLNFGLAMELVKLGRNQEAVTQFERVASLDPDYIPAYFQKAQAFLAMSRTEDAVRALRKGIAVAGRIGDSHAAGEMTELLETLQ